jgi:hypothetical protein
VIVSEEQCHVKFVLKLLYLLRQSALSDEQSFGSLRETEQLRYLDEIFQLTKFHTTFDFGCKIRIK